LQDVAVRLNTNSSYVSECINSVRSQSFSQFVNTYRVSHAQELLRQQPDMKTATVATNSGFSTEASFFRNFKVVTGMTPREWVGNQQ
jgi:YesN/AraC family two-component response regulator